MGKYDWDDDEIDAEIAKERASRRKTTVERVQKDYKLDLHAPVLTTEQSNATIPVAWCFKPDSPLRQIFEDQKWVNPHLLLVVSTQNGAGEWKDSAIYAAKITEALKYVSFRRPGANRVKAVIVDVASKEAKARLSDLTYRKRWDNEFSLSDPVVRDYDSIGLAAFGHVLYDSNAEFVVNVPKEMFAAPPTGFKKAILDYWFDPKKKLVDACDSRRKAWVIGTPAWVVTLPAMYVLKVLALVFAAVCGSRLLLEKQVYRNFLNPLAAPWRMMNETFDDSSIYVRPKAKDGRQQDAREEWGMLIALLNPAIWFGPASIWYGIGSISQKVTEGKGELKHSVMRPLSHWGYWETVVRVDLGILTVFVLVGLLIGFLYLTLEVKVFAKLLSMVDRGLRSVFTKSPTTPEEREKDRRLMLDRLALLSCGPDGAPMSVSELPKELRTLSLRYNELKTKVCKPFAT